MRRYWVLISVLLVLFSAERVVVMAQDAPVLNFGTPVTENEIRAMDTLVDQEGKKLPRGQGTVAEGATLYSQRCAMCHGPKGEGTNTPAGVGPVLLADEAKGELGVRKYYFATTLFSYILRAMPLHQERTLTVDQAYALTAFLLQRNGLIKENEVMNADTLAKVRMPRQGEWKHPSEEISG